MFHPTQTQPLLVYLEELSKLDLSELPAEIREVIGRMLQEGEKLSRLDQHLVVGVRDTRTGTGHYPILVPQQRRYAEADFLATFDTSSDTDEDYTYLVHFEAHEVQILPLEGEL